MNAQGCVLHVDIFPHLAASDAFQPYSFVDLVDMETELTINIYHETAQRIRLLEKDEAVYKRRIRAFINWPPVESDDVPGIASPQAVTEAMGIKRLKRKKSELEAWNIAALPAQLRGRHAAHRNDLTKLGDKLIQSRLYDAIMKRWNRRIFVSGGWSMAVTTMHILTP